MTLTTHHASQLLQSEPLSARSVQSQHAKVHILPS
jgi:hypothetical protein